MKARILKVVLLGAILGAGTIAFSSGAIPGPRGRLLFGDSVLHL